MQFQVPQFIDIEDKIIGPFTLKQFLYLGTAGGFSFVLFFALQTWLWIAITIIMGIAAAALAFIRYNGQPMIRVLTSATKFLWQPKFYLWRYTSASQKLPTIHSLPKPGMLAQNPLKNLWLKLNTSKEAIPNREKNLPQNIIAASH